MTFPLMPWSPYQRDPASFAYLTDLQNLTALTTYTFSSVSLGAAASTRVIVVFVQGVRSSGASVSSCTVGGVSATRIETESSTNFPGALFTAVVPSGTTGDIVVTFNGTMSECAIGVYRATGMSATPADWELKSDGSSASETLTVDVVEGGAVASFALRGNNNNLTWTGLSEDFETAFTYTAGVAINGKVGGASLFPVPATVAGKTYTVAASGGTRFDNITISLQPLT